jgi:glycine C-acetyltransferase
MYSSSRPVPPAANGTACSDARDLYTLEDHAAASIAAMRAANTYRTERPISGAQGRVVALKAPPERNVVNFCANNYLGLANDERLKAHAALTLFKSGIGMASVRFICGTHDEHTRLESTLARFLGTDDAILFGSCFDANTGLFEALLGEADAVISDSLNHASIIDGIRLCKAKRLRYANSDMEALEQCLEEAADARLKLIVTDGVFSMDGSYAKLDRICDLAQQYGAEVMVDDSHAVGFVGGTGRGTPELFGVQSQVALRTGTLGKALGGSLGGYAAGAANVVALLRQRARPYLFSNALPPYVATAARAAIEIVEADPEPGRQLMRNAIAWRAGLEAKGFEVIGDQHPIVPVMMPSPNIAARFAEGLESEGVYVTAFSYPVVPQGRDRIRTQVGAAHTADDLALGLAAFEAVGRTLGVIG